MRISLFLIPLFFLISANTFSQDILAQRIDFVVVNVPIDIALDKLAFQTGIDIAYSKNFFKRSDPVSINVQQERIDNILTEILAETEIDFEALGENRVLLFKEVPILYTVNGYIEDLETGERIVGAKIWCEEQNCRAISNEYGYFSFYVSPGELTLYAKSVGYKEFEEVVTIEEDQSITLKLQIMTNLPVVEVDADDPFKIESSPAVSIDQNNILEISPQLVNSTPNLNGQKDYSRVSYSLPGIQAGSDGLGGMNVRGGESGQNLILMDGTPVYIPYHLLGFYSVYNPETVKSVKIVRGNAPSRYGSAVSSIMDVRIREGNMYEWKGGAQVSLLDGSLTLEGPIKKNKGSILLAMRYSPKATFFEPTLSQLYFENHVDSLETRFYDLNLKANYQLGERDRLYLSIFSGKDIIRERTLIRYSSAQQSHTAFEMDWNNNLGSLRWNHLFGRSLFLNTTVTYSQYQHQFSSLNQFREVTNVATVVDRFIIDNRSSNVDAGLKLDFDYLINKKHSLRFGLNYNYRNFRPGFYFIQDTEFDVDDDVFGKSDYDYTDYYEENALPEYLIHESAVYLEEHFKLRRWFFNFGARLSAFTHGNTQYANIEPRLLGKYLASENVSVSLTLNRRMQYLHLIANPSIQLPNDLWIPSTETIKPQELYEAELGLQYAFSKKLKLSAAAYYRQINNIYSYPETFEFLYSTEDYTTYNYLHVGTAYNQGAELLADYSDGKKSVLFSYTLSKAERQFDSLNLGNRFYANFDSRHQLNLSFYHHLVGAFTVGFNWVYQSPRPKVNVLRLIADGTASSFSEDPVGQRNTTRSAPYNRIDVGVQFEHKGKKLQHNASIGAYNVLNFKNVAFQEVLSIDGSTGQIVTEPRYSLPILPTFSYKISFYKP